MILKQMKAAYLLAALCLVCIASSRLMQGSQPAIGVIVPLNTPVKYSQQAYTYAYYQTVIKSPSSDQVVLITVAADIQTRVGIYVSTSDSPNFINGTWPNRTSFTQQCFYSSIDTCALHMPDLTPKTSLTIYFTITVMADCNYTLDVSLQTVYQIKVDKTYTVSLLDAQSAMVELPASYFVTDDGGKVQQIVITCFYTSYTNLGHFTLLAAEGDFPNPSHYSTIKSKSLNGFTQILQLPPLSQMNSSYYILIQGQNNTKFNFTTYAIQSLANPQLIINQSVSYLTNTSINYTYNAMYPANTLNSTLPPLHINLYAYRGHGKFVVDYCNLLYNMSYQNTAGENAQIVITQKMRKSCYKLLVSEGGLLIQNITVSITDVYYEFGYAIGLYEDSYEDYLLPGQKEISTLVGNNDSNVFIVDAFSVDTDYTLSIEVYIGSINVTVLQCKPINGTNNNCSVLVGATLTEPTEVLSKLNYTCQAHSSCKVRILPYKNNNNNNYSKYSIINQYSQQQLRELSPNNPITDIVLMNQYRFYYVNVSQLRNNPIYKFGNATLISIRKTEINGDSILLTSTATSLPTFKDIIGRSSDDVKYHWEGHASYVANSTHPSYIYIGILGDTESIYHLQCSVNSTANIPAAYLDLVEDGDNNYVISKASPYILLKYVSHIVPYSITIDPLPGCVKLGSKLPIPDICVASTDLPTQYHDRVIYFNISSSLATSNAQFKFSMYVNSGSYLLTEDKPILISCQRACYELVVVMIPKANATVNVIHSGQGTIKVVSNTSSTMQVSNGVLPLQCNNNNGNCIYTLNASMGYGGNMEIAYESSSGAEVEWRTKPMSLPVDGSPKHYYMRIPKYTDFMSVIFYAEAADLTVYYNIMAFNEQESNTLDYEYPTTENHLEVSYGNPLQEQHIVDISMDDVEALKCKQPHMVCIATFTVALNSSVQYSSQYLYSGLGYYSSNTYQYDISPTWPILSLSQSYSLSYFTHKIDFAGETTTSPYSIYIQPISNCRPQLQTQSTAYIKNYYNFASLPRVMPGQSKVNYRVLANQICMYDTGISNTPNMLVFPNIIYSININIKANDNDSDRGYVVLTYQHRSYSASTFIVKLKQKVASIIVSRVSYRQSPEQAPTLVLPSKDNNVAYVNDSSTLVLNEAQSEQYLILIQYGSSKARQISMMVQLKNQAIILLHNQQHTYTYDPYDNSINAETSSIVHYEYHSTNPFYIFISLNKLSLRLTVTNADVWDQSAELYNVVISNASDPWIYLNPFNSTNSTNTQKLVNYKIQCEFLSEPPAGTTATYKLHVEEDGIAGLTQLYEGVSTYDAFIHSTAMNCYKFVAPMILGQDTMTVDLNFVGNSQKQIQQLNLTGQLVQGIATIASSNGGSKNKLRVRQSKISSTAMRMQIDYVVNSAYKLCYVLKSNKLVGVQYSVVVNVPSMPMLYSNTYPNHSAIFSDPYVMFEYINHRYDIYTPDTRLSEPILMTVTNCLGSSTILAAASYDDMETGKMTEVKSQWTGNGITAALVDVPHGYYYFAVKAASSNSMFRATVQPAGIVDGRGYLLQNLYYINWNIKPRIGAVMINQVEYVNIQVPTILKSKAIGPYFNPSKIVYSLYLLNLGNDSNPTKYSYNIDTYTRCPSLFTSPNSSQSQPFKPIATTVINNPYSSSNTLDVAQFNVNINDFRPMSNISVKAQVYLEDDDGDQNVLVYYYGQDEIQIIDEEQGSLWKPFKWMFMLSLLFICLGCIAFGIKFYLRRRGRTINFQVSEYPMGQELQNRPIPQQRQLNTANVSTNRRPLNQGVGYGEFVDQA